MANNYPEWWNTTITVYNKYEDPTTREITWYKSTIKNCFWKYTGNKVTVGDTTLETNATICRVPVNKNFREKYLWNDADKSKYFTFGPGDIIVKGTATDEINEYTTGHRSSDLLAKYKKLQGCFIVERCSINVSPGLGTEHYYVRGI